MRRGFDTSAKNELLPPKKAWGHEGVERWKRRWKMKIDDEDDDDDDGDDDDDNFIEGKDHENYKHDDVNWKPFFAPWIKL